MEPHDAIPRLERLRDEAMAFQRKPLIGSDLRQWYDDVLDTLSQIYGQDSSTRQGFEQIRFGFPPETFQCVAERLHTDLQQRGIDLPASFSIPLGDYYQEPLIEAAEFLRSLIIQLRRG